MHSSAVCHNDALHAHPLKGFTIENAPVKMHRLIHYCREYEGMFHNWLGPYTPCFTDVAVLGLALPSFSSFGSEREPHCPWLVDPSAITCELSSHAGCMYHSGHSTPVCGHGRSLTDNTVLKVHALRQAVMDRSPHSDCRQEMQ